MRQAKRSSPVLILALLELRGTKSDTQVSDSDRAPYAADRHGMQGMVVPAAGRITTILESGLHFFADSAHTTVASTYLLQSQGLSGCCSTQTYILVGFRSKLVPLNNGSTAQTHAADCHHPRCAATGRQPANSASSGHQGRQHSRGKKQHFKTQLLAWQLSYRHHQQHRMWQSQQ